MLNTSSHIRKTIKRNYAIWVNQTVLYALLTLLAALSYALIVSGLSLVVGRAIDPAHPILVGLVIFVVALLANPVRSRLQGSVDNLFFRGQAAHRSRLQAFGKDLTQALDLPAIALLLRRYLNESLAPAQIHIFVHDPSSGQYLPMVDETGSATTSLHFAIGGPLVKWLSGLRRPVLIGEVVRVRGGGEDQAALQFSSLPASLKSEQPRLALLGAQLFIPLHGQKHLIGWIALGPRRMGRPYQPGELGFMDSLSGQAAVAIERAQVISDLERRIHEMNVLTRVAQGINFTVAFDDILELIYAQTIQVISTVDFRVLLLDRDSETVYYAFYLENDERLNERENIPLPGGRSLEFDVLQSQRPLITADYERECRARSFLPDTPGLYAWMGVPMNAGAGTTGVLSLASRDPGVVYTEDQRNLMQAIADQASGAIVKARLLQETERRARQLASLNEIARSLTSTLELKPLLSSILYSAVEILNCQAGSLFLVDDQTGESVFEVVIGPVASDLVGKRLPPGAGLVGQAVQTGRGLIANDAKRRKEWFEKTDNQTGFDTQDLLVVPMLYKDRVIGVIEVINKADGSAFNASDMDLLTTFSSQATIAIENARLYTLTDQALAARVEELSVMQRIDRELNASLDVERAMRITLDWAMRQSGLEAGLVGIVSEHGIQVVTAEGYGEELAAYQPVGEAGTPQKPLPSQLPALQAALLSGQPQLLPIDLLSANTAPGQAVILPGTRLQVVIPIQREAHVVGLLLLESARKETCSDESIAFLSRLADHAVIAITNAQLYGEVEAANLAKSKFVSFVAHELKNPMSSIKGYTELVANGMAGPVNELQASFLATVRSNVERMNTIVTDLNDMTKIQVGSLRLEYKTVQVKETVDDVIRSLRRHVEEKEQVLTLDIPADLPPVWADPGRLSQVLTNLLSNASKYTPVQGQIVVGAARLESPAAEHLQMASVHIWVKDTGIGIPDEDKGKIFQSYFRTDISKETATGTGLGLTITKSLVEMQGGRIWFDSELGKGTTFHITIPLAES